MNKRGRCNFSAKGGTKDKLVDAIELIVDATGSSPETLHHHLAQLETDHPRAYVQSEPDPELLGKLIQENRELKRANDILQRVATCFARVEQDRELGR